MLALTRRAGESVHIGTATVTVVKVTSGGAVRLAIDAPPDVLVLREELVDTVLEGGRGKVERQSPRAKSQRPAPNQRAPSA